MPWHGPVAYHPQPSFFRPEVISTGADQVPPLSLEEMWSTSLLFRQKTRWTVPDPASITGTGFPMVISAFPPPSWIIRRPDQVRPWSVDRFITRSMSPWSLRLFFLASQNARREPSFAMIAAGMRKLW